MVIVSKCYEVVTQESAEQGGASDQGFEYEDQSFSFRDLISEMEEYNQTSDYPASPDSWLMSEPTHDYRTGEETIYSLHYNRDNNPRSAKYWEKAMRKVGLLK
jgi:hypothetical protein